MKLLLPLARSPAKHHALRMSQTARSPHPALVPARVSRAARQWRQLLGALALGSVAVACGKPATEADCEKIVTRVTELELQEAHVSDPVQVQAQIEAAKRSFRERALKECVGKRISKSELDCVAHATHATQIVEECF